MTDKHRLRRAGIGGISALVCAGTALMITQVPANAAWQTSGGQVGIVDTATATPGTQGATGVLPGKTDQPLGDVQLLVPNKYLNGDSINLTMSLQDPGSGSVPNHDVGFSGKLTDDDITVTGPYTPTSKLGPTNGTGTASDTSLVKDTTAGAVGDPPKFSVGAFINSDNVHGTETVILTNSAKSDGTAPTDLWLVTIKGIHADLGSAVPSGEVRITPQAVNIAILPTPVPPVAGKTDTFGPAGAQQFTVAGFVLPASVTVADPSGIKANAGAQAVGDITVAEISQQAFPTTVVPPATASSDTYTVTVSGADVANTATQKVTAKLVSTIKGETLDSTEATVHGPGAASDPNTVSFTLHQSDAAASDAAQTKVVLSGLLLSSTSTSPITYELSGPGLGLSTPSESDVNQTDIAAPTIEFTGTSVTAPTRISGIDRYATAARVAMQNAPGGAKTMVVASGQAYPDALSSSFLTQELGSGAGVLLTRTDTLPTATVQALTNLGTTKVYVVGGAAAVSDSVVQQLQTVVDQNAGVAGTGTVRRIFGPDRYATNQAINSFATGIQGASIGTTQVTFGQAAQKTAILATGEDFADALSASPATAGANNPIPLILTRADELSPDAASQLSAFGIGQVLIVGGDSAVSQAVQTQLTTEGYDVLRLSGADRYGTAAAVATFETQPTAPASATDQGGLGFDAGAADDQEAILATGLKYADALTGGPLAAGDHAPVLLTKADVLSTPTSDWLTGKKADYSDVIGLGGPAAVSDATLLAANQAVD